MISRRDLCLLLPSALLLQSCAEPPKETAKKKEPEKPPEPVTGRKAVYQMLISARAWAPDVQPLELASIHLQEVKSAGGKFGAWQCIFVSPSKHKLKIFTYSAIEAGGNLHKGVFSSNEESFTGSRGSALPFLTAAIKTDSDAIYEAALKKAADVVKKSPDIPIGMNLEYTKRFPQPVWRVFWGESVSSSKYSLFYDAPSGEYLSR